MSLQSTVGTANSSTLHTSQILYLFIEYLLMSLDVAPIATILLATILLPQSPLRTEALL